MVCQVTSIQSLNNKYYINRPLGPNLPGVVISLLYLIMKINIIEMEEIWKPVIGYEGYYEVSNLGRVKRLDRYDYGCGYARFYKGRILKNLMSKTSSYYHVQLCKNGTKLNKSVHRLVAEAFLPNPDNLPCVNHKSEVKTDNRPENLEWCSQEYNLNYGTRNIRTIKTKIEKGLMDPDAEGLSSTEIKRLWTEKHKEEIKEKRHQSYLQNKDKVKERVRRYYYEHREKVLERIKNNKKNG